MTEEGIWVNPSMFDLRQKMGAAFQNSEADMVDFVAQVMMDMLNSGDIAINNKKQRRVTEWAIAMTGIRTNLVTQWKNIYNYDDVPSIDQRERMSPMIGIAKFRCLQYLAERAERTGFDPIGVHPKFEGLALDCYVGTNDIFRNKNYYKGEDGKLIHRYAGLKILDGATCLTVPYKKTSRDNQKNASYWESMAGRNLWRYSENASMSRIRIALYILAETEPDDPLNVLAGKYLDKANIDLADRVLHEIKRFAHPTDQDTLQDERISRLYRRILHRDPNGSRIYKALRRGSSRQQRIEWSRGPD